MKSTEFVIENMRLKRSAHNKNYAAVICIFDNRHSANMAAQRVEGVEHEENVRADIYYCGKDSFLVEFRCNSDSVHDADAVQIACADIKTVVGVTRVPHIIRQIGWEDLPPEEEPTLPPARRPRGRPRKVQPA